MRYYENIVSKRNSCRLFSDAEVESSKLAEVEAYYEVEDRLVPEIETELAAYDGSVYDALGKHVGYNGICIKAPKYYVIYSEKADHYLENAGFTMQAVTLKLTELDLAACWLTVNDAEAAAEALGYSGDKVVAGVLAFGYRSKDDDAKKAPKIALNDLVYSKTYGNPFNRNLVYRELEDSLMAVAHAQSFLNKQPYRLIIDDDIVSLIGLPDEQTNENDEYLNYGIAMFNFQEVMDAVRPNAPKWKFEDDGRDLRLPAGAKFIAKCGI